MLRTEREIEDEAIGWVVCLRDADEAEWAAFTLWLEADARHAAAYDEAALADADAGQLAPAPAVEPLRTHAPEALPARATRRSILGWAAAASIVLGAGLFTLGVVESGYDVETAAGERRVIALDDGSRISLNGGSKVGLDRHRPRYAKLERGEALFEVVHDDRRPFEVDVGDALLRDMGTVFNVVADAGRLDVAVSEGAVLYNPGREAKTITPGLALRKVGASPAAIGAVTPQAVGGWREGRLVYAGGPVSAIAADLSRNLGVPVIAERRIASQPFSGIILIAGPKREVLERSAALLGLKLRRSGDGWLLARAGDTG